MAKLPVINWEKATVGECELSDQIAETPYHPYIVKDAVVHYRAGIRQGTHSTKTRSDVAGGHHKPWRQKGTGRARSGTASSPLWRHGGVVFGPHPRDYSNSINKKVYKKALSSVLAEKLRNEELMVLDGLQLDQPKTKILKQCLSDLGCGNVLMVLDEVPQNLHLAARNLPEVEVITYRSLNVYRVLLHQKVLFVKDALTAVEKRLLS